MHTSCSNDSGGYFFLLPFYAGLLHINSKHNSDGPVVKRNYISTLVNGSYWAGSIGRYPVPRSGERGSNLTPSPISCNRIGS